jgi:FKBP-type peptidyl-prolyl cis-trans isomerase
MPRIRLAAGWAVAALMLVACGGDDDDDTSSATSTPEATTDTSDSTDSAATSATSTPDESVVDGTLVPQTTIAAPAVDIPDSIPTTLVVTELTPGSGHEAVDGDTVLVNYVGVRSEDGTEFDSNFGSDPFPVTLGSGGVIEGWEQGLQGAQTGQRVQLDIPADLAYGDSPPGDPIQPGDALTFVIDVLVVVPATDPADAPSADDVPVEDAPVDEVVIDDVTVGDGATFETGMTGILHLVAARADDGSVLQSSWDAGQPAQLQLVDGDVLDGLIEGLTGMKVGGRRIMTIPFELAFGAEGEDQLGLPPSTDLVVIADLLAAY